MPVVKPISGHTGCRGIYNYLNKDGRALAVDLFNLSWDERDMEGYEESAKSSIDWAAEMDFTRAAYGNDRPYRGKRARTFKHYVLSPDPTDMMDLPRMREFSRAWALENFDGYEIAITYHDDNEGEIMHAHVVVNNTHLETGRRLQDPDPRALKRSAQRLAKERNMAFFVDEPVEAQAFEAFGDFQPKQRKAEHFRRAERELAEQGKYSWVADIRARVALAKGLAIDTAEFIGLLNELGVEVSDAAKRDGRADWLYRMQGHDAWKIRGESLGTAYEKTAIETSLHAGVSLSRCDIESIARNAIEVENYDELKKMAEVVSLINRCKVASLADFDRRIEATSSAKTARELIEARSYCEQKRLLPEAAPHKPRNTPPVAKDNPDQDANPRGSGRGKGGARHHHQVIQQRRDQHRKER